MPIVPLLARFCIYLGGIHMGTIEKVPPSHKRNRLRHIIYENGRGRIEPPIEPVGQSAFLIIRPKVESLRKSTRSAPLNL